MSFLLQQLVSSFKDRLDTHNSHKLSLSTFVILSAFSMHSMPHIQNVEQTNGIKTKANILSISVAKYWEQEVERCWIAAKKINSVIFQSRGWGSELPSAVLELVGIVILNGIIFITECTSKTEKTNFDMLFAERLFFTVCSVSSGIRGRYLAKEEDTLSIE